MDLLAHVTHFEMPAAILVFTLGFVSGAGLMWGWSRLASRGRRV